AEDGIRDLYVTRVQTCALPICSRCCADFDAEFLAALLGVFLHGLGAKVGTAARAVLAFVQAEENVVLVVAAHGRTGQAQRAEVRSEERRVGKGGWWSRARGSIL